jgi:hypothetical protein
MTDERTIDEIEKHSLYAWVGEDEMGSGRIGIKQALVPAGYIPLVTMDYDRHKIEGPSVRTAMELQAAAYKKRIRLVRFVFAEVVAETEWICTPIRAAVLTRPCHICGRPAQGLDGLHIVAGEYYCALHCPVHADQAR